MKQIENECCDCATPDYPCIGNSCPNRNVAHYYCDECGSEGRLRETEWGELCEYCLIQKFPIVEGSDY
jgi:hypothetical protein